MSEQSINCVIMPVTGARLLLPNAAIAAMVSYQQPAPTDSDADWLEGMFSWQGWQVPLISWPVMMGMTGQESHKNCRIAVVKSLGQNRQFPYYGLLLQGFPRLTEIQPDEMVLALDEDDSSPVNSITRHQDSLVTCVQVFDQQVIMPDLEKLSQLVNEALS